MRVLVVEDEVKMAALVERGLQRRGDAVDVTSCGENALWMAEAREYNAIVLDVPKPFSLAELSARLRAQVRRAPVERPAVLEVGDLRLDPATRRTWRGGAELRLGPKEFALLELFMRRPGEALSRLQLLEHGWDEAYENRSNVVDVYVGHLRAKIDRPFGTRSIETVRGGGYRLREDGGA